MSSTTTMFRATRPVFHRSAAARLAARRTAGRRFQSTSSSSGAAAEQQQRGPAEKVPEPDAMDGSGAMDVDDPSPEALHPASAASLDGSVPPAAARDAPAPLPRRFPRPADRGDPPCEPRDTLIKGTRTAGDIFGYSTITGEWWKPQFEGVADWGLKLEKDLK